MTNQLHPCLDDLVPSVVTTIHRRFRAYTERSDLLQEAWAFVLTRAENFNELLSDENEVQRKWNEKRVAWQIRRCLERYARKEKASKSGYHLNDEAYYGLYWKEYERQMQAKAEAEAEEVEGSNEGN